MPFCTQCGQQVADADVFCANCGRRQPGAGGEYRAPGSPPVLPPDPLAGISPRTASILCYVPVMGWIAAVVVLAARNFRRDKIVRFHAFQGLYLFAAWLAVQWLVHPLMWFRSEHFMRLDNVLEGVIIAVSIFMMVRTSHDDPYVLPIIGELAQRSAAEQ